VLFLGPSGTGKSAFAKALGTEVGLPTIILDIGKLRGSLYGQTEQHTRQALRLLSAMRRNIAFVDECEKALSGVANSGQTDSGVTSGQFGTILQHMADHPGDSFFVLTANNIQALPPEFSRAGRINAVFFIDLPTPRQRDRIWEIHANRFGLHLTGDRPVDTDWTGAEIASCCETADLLGISIREAGEFTVPTSRTNPEAVQRLRTWAHGRCLDASRPGLYQSTTPPPPRAEGGPRRQIERLDPGLN